MGKAKASSSPASSDSEAVEAPPPGEGGYRLAIYKHEELKKVMPLDKTASEYVRTKHKKHKGSSGSGVQESHKKISKKSAKITSPSSSSTAEEKPKRVLTEKQKVALAKGREKAAAARAEKKKQAEAQKVGTGVFPYLRS